MSTLDNTKLRDIEYLLMSPTKRHKNDARLAKDIAELLAYIIARVPDTFEEAADLILNNRENLYGTELALMHCTIRSYCWNTHWHTTPYSISTPNDCVNESRTDAEDYLNLNLSDQQFLIAHGLIYGIRHELLVNKSDESTMASDVAKLFRVAAGVSSERDINALMNALRCTLEALKRMTERSSTYAVAIASTASSSPKISNERPLTYFDGKFRAREPLKKGTLLGCFSYPNYGILNADAIASEQLTHMETSNVLCHHRGEKGFHTISV